MRDASRCWPLRLEAFLVCLSLAGCAGIGTSQAPGDGRGQARTPANEPLSPQAAMDRIAAGRSTRAEVSAALGSGIAVAFDNGHEVWIYRWPGADGTTRSAAELVLLFDPSGTVKKVRVRPGYPARR